MHVMDPEFALLPDRDVMVGVPLTKVGPRPPSMRTGYERRIPGAAKAPELGMMCEDWDRPSKFIGCAQLKVDGWRAIYLGGDRPRVVTREGEPLLACDNMLGTLAAIESIYGEPMMFDGEFAMPGGLEETTAAGRAGGDTLTGVLWLFDAIPLSAWMTNTITAHGVEDRVDMLIARAMRVKRPNVGVLRAIGVVGDDSAQALAERVWGMGGEGIVLKDSDSPYIRERSRYWRKLKRTDEIKATVVGAKPGGALLLRASNGKEFTVMARGEAAEQIRRYPDAFTGRTAIVKASGYTTKGTPRHAVFLRMEDR